MEHATGKMSQPAPASFNIKPVGAMVSSASGYKASLLFWMARCIPVKLMQYRMQKKL